jgi:hypothetical protein
LREAAANGRPRAMRVDAQATARSRGLAVTRSAPPAADPASSPAAVETISGDLAAGTEPAAITRRRWFKWPPVLRSR